MLDRLAMTSQEKLDPDFTSEQLRGLFTNITETGTKYHRRVLSYRVAHSEDEDSQLLSIHFQPRASSISPTKIEINPARFESYEKMTAIVARVVDTGACIITRLDHSVDLPVEIERINASLTWPRKQDREVYKNNSLTGFYLGRPPEQLVVYDRARKLRVSGPITRMELRQYRDRLPVRSYSALPSLAEYEPFERIRWINLEGRGDEAGTRQLHSIQFLSKMIELGGAQHAFKCMNKHSNFRRNYLDCLGRPDFIPDPDTTYKANLRRYFAGGTHGD